MPERSGYIYRGADVSRDELRALLGADSRGWAWTPAFMYTHGARRADELLRGADGCAHRDGIEIRWRPAAQPAVRAGEQRYDVLVLALAPLDLAGFTPVPPDGAAWQVQPMNLRLQHPLGDSPATSADEPRAATGFVAPGGAIQFVALIETTDD
jgi:hypothetical protein